MRRSCALHPRADAKFHFSPKIEKRATTFYLNSRFDKLNFHSF